MVPKQLSKIADDTTLADDLAQDRKSFIEHVANDDVIPLALCRIKAKVMGYIDDNFGILEIADGKEVRCVNLFRNIGCRICAVFAEMAASPFSQG